MRDLIALLFVIMLGPRCTSAFRAGISSLSSITTHSFHLKNWRSPPRPCSAACGPPEPPCEGARLTMTKQLGSSGRCESLLESILRAEQASRPLIGSWNCIGSPDVTEVLADSGMDFVCIDVEHSGISLETVAHNIRAAQAALCPPVVRVAGLGPGQPNFKEIMRVLDLGATAVIVPGALSKTDVQAALGAGQFTKTRMSGCASGFRGANPFVRAGCHGLQAPSDYHRKSNAQTLIIPLLETPSALKNVEDIMQVEGLQVVAFGPFDLSVAMGFDGVRTKEVEELLMKGVEAAISRGVRPILPVLDATEESTAATLHKWQGKGVQIFTVGVDKALLARAATGLLTACRS